MQFGAREVTASQVARVLGMMARTHSGLSDGIGLQVRGLRENITAYAGRSCGDGCLKCDRLQTFNSIDCSTAGTKLLLVLQLLEL